MIFCISCINWKSKVEQWLKKNGKKNELTFFMEATSTITMYEENGVHKDDLTIPNKEGVRKGIEVLRQFL